MGERSKDERKKNAATSRWLKIAALVVVGVVCAVVIVCSLPEREESHRIYAAWYIETEQGPLVVAQHSTHLGAVSLGGDSRRDIRAFSATRLFTYRADTGEKLATYPFPRGTESRVIGPAGDRLWLRVGDEPVLLQASDLSVAADAAAIRTAIGSELGGDFAFTHPSGRIHPYDRHLELKGADGKAHYVSATLEHLRPDDTRKIPPEGYTCHANAPDLISPKLLVCLPPTMAPATSLIKSSVSALDEDAGVQLSAIDANDGMKVLWTRRVAALASGPETASLLRGQVLTDERVVLLVQTGDEMIDAVFIDPSNGETLESKAVIRPAPASN